MYTVAILLMHAIMLMQYDQHCQECIWSQLLKIQRVQKFKAAKNNKYGVNG